MPAGLPTLNNYSLRQNFILMLMRVTQANFRILPNRIFPLCRLTLWINRHITTPHIPQTKYATRITSAQVLKTPQVPRSRLTPIAIQFPALNANKKLPGRGRLLDPSTEQMITDAAARKTDIATTQHLNRSGRCFLFLFFKQPPLWRLFCLFIDYKKCRTRMR